ncbi:MAG: extracellular solute-binding protein [Lachnospiraceae bacterium]|nr:extracellular solute-binding protein [Lachnospiraceae bacterium]
MRNMFKRVMALLLALAMVLSLAACGEQVDETDAPKNDTTEAPASNDGTQAPSGETEAPDDGALDTSWIIEEDTSISGKVNFWTAFKGSAGMDAMIAEFNEIYPNIEVVLTPYSNNSDGNLGVNTALTSGEIDVLVSFGVSHLFNRAETGLLMDITDKCAEEGIDLVEQWNFDCYKYEDAIYSFPCGGLSYYVAINMDMWNEAGLGELPTEWTWDEYLEACKAMHKVAADGTIEVYGGSDYHSYNYWMYANAQEYGGDVYYSPDGTPSYDEPLLLQALERKLKAELEDELWYPCYRYRADNIQAQMTFCQGEVASVVIPNVVRFLHDTETYPDVDWITGFAPYPTEYEGQENHMAGVAPFSHAGMAANCQDEDAAWAFLKWYSTYGVKYLVAAGHQPGWNGTEAGAAVEIIYGSVEEAEKWIDVESYNRVVGNPNLPSYAETNLLAYTEITGVLKDPTMQAINGELTAKEALDIMIKEAEAVYEAAK